MHEEDDEHSRSFKLKTLEGEVHTLTEQVRSLKRKLRLVRAPVFLPDCEVLNGLPHDMWHVILGNHFGNKELAQLALVSRVWSQRIREILAPRRVHVVRFSVDNVTKGIQWTSPTWEWCSHTWKFLIHDVGPDLSLRLELVNCGSDKISPIFVRTKRTIISHHGQERNYVRISEHRYGRGGRSTLMPWLFYMLDPQKGWIKDGHMEMELEMESGTAKLKNFRADPFFILCPDFLVSVCGVVYCRGSAPIPLDNLIDNVLLSERARNQPVPTPGARLNGVAYPEPGTETVLRSEILNSSLKAIATSALPDHYNVSGNSVEILPYNYDEDSVLQRYTEDADGAFWVVDLGRVREQIAQWHRELPRVAPYYAVKCNPNPVIIKMMSEYGVNFDCASESEIALVTGLGISADRIIFANPCKFASHIKSAHSMGCNMMTFDNEEELMKIARYNPAAQVVMRIATDDSKARYQFSSKFGARPQTWESLILKCDELKLDLIGVSFHVGSGSSDNTVYPSTLRNVRRVFDLAAQHGITMTLVDIGGGFPGVAEWNPSFPDLASGIRTALDDLFPENNIRVIGEPGRYMVAQCHTLCVSVASRRMTPEASGDNVLYYVDDGVYGSFSCMPFDDYKPQPIPLPAVREREHRKATIFGPTCDSLDCLGKEFDLPVLEIGDWLYFHRMGAYTTASTTRFNGFCNTTFRYIDSSPLCIEEFAIGHTSLRVAVTRHVRESLDIELSSSGSDGETSS